MYRELQGYKKHEDITQIRLYNIKKNNLYDLYRRVANEDPYETDLFKAIFEYKIFSKYYLLFTRND